MSQSTTVPEPASGPLAHLKELARLEPHLKMAIGWSFAYFFCVLCSYSIIRPLRDAMGVTVGGDGLERLFAIVFLVMLVAVPAFGWVVAKVPRRLVAPVIYGFFLTNLVLFWVILGQSNAGVLSASAFFVWVSVFNLFVVSLFWIVMADIWTTGEAKRFYGVIAAGGSAGALSGPFITQSLVKELGPANLLLVSALFLSAAIVCALRLRRLIGQGSGEHEKPAGGGIIAGAVRVFQSPYLLQIALWVLVTNLISTFFYFEQARIVKAALPERVDQVQLFARMDLAVNVLAVLAQVFITSAVIRRAGVGMSVAAMPLAAMLGLVALAIAPSLAVIVVVIVAERAIGFGITNPAARVLYTVVSPEDKYKSQNFIDTVVFRGGDAASGFIFNSGAKSLGLATPTVAALTLPFALAWIYLSLRLGREQEAKAAARPVSVPGI